MNVSAEIWKSVVGFEGSYMVSDFGNVKSLARNTTAGKILKPGKTSFGYLLVNLCVNGKQHRLYVHRLVAAAFLANHEGFNDVNHKDGIKVNNRLENLEWCTRSMNMLHAVKTGLMPIMNGETNGQSKLTADQVLQIKTQFKDLGGATVARMFGVTNQTIYFIRRSQTWKHI